jgi:hypothetical protein
MYEERIAALVKTLQDLGFNKFGEWSPETKSAYALAYAKYGGLEVHVVHRSVEHKVLVHRHEEKTLDEPVLELVWVEHNKAWKVMNCQLAQWVVGR